jgi:hypothetical protein
MYVTCHCTKKQPLPRNPILPDCHRTHHCKPQGWHNSVGKPWQLRTSAVAHSLETSAQASRTEASTCFYFGPASRLVSSRNSAQSRRCGRSAARGPSRSGQTRRAPHRSNPSLAAERKSSPCHISAVIRPGEWPVGNLENLRAAK